MSLREGDMPDHAKQALEHLRLVSQGKATLEIHSTMYCIRQLRATIEDQQEEIDKLKQFNSNMTEEVDTLKKL